jgi:hypothetical protein
MFYTGDGQTVSATLFKPIKRSEEEWTCAFVLTGLNREIRVDVPGTDGMQSLLLALEGIRVNLEQAGLSIRWEFGEPEDTGIPRYVPSSYGVTVERHLTKVMNDEIEKMIAEKRAPRTPNG